MRIKDKQKEVQERKKNERSALARYVQRHAVKYGAKPGYRRCKYGLVDGCLKVAPQHMFKGLLCHACLAERQRSYYDARIQRNSGQAKRDPPPASKRVHPRA